MRPAQRWILVLAVAACTLASGALAQDKTYTAPGQHHVHAAAPFPSEHARCMKFVDDYLATVKAGIDRGYKLPFNLGWQARIYMTMSEQDWGVPAQADAATMAEQAARDLAVARTKLDAQKADLQKTRDEVKNARDMPLARRDWQQAADLSEGIMINLDSEVRRLDAKAAFARCSLDNARR
jgi:hypothetical protein